MSTTGAPSWTPPTPTPKKPRSAARIVLGVILGIVLTLIISAVALVACVGAAVESADEAIESVSTPAAEDTAAGAGAPTAAAPSQTPAPEETPAGTVAQQNALEAAQSYLEFGAFSRLGLIGQLSSEYGDGYSVADATWAVDHLVGVDWKEQAVRSGQSYLDMSAYSRAGLIEQLSSEYGDKFTKAEATYAADRLGL
jgi:hypothetical protein